jgi:hypothetical protein
MRATSLEYAGGQVRLRTVMVEEAGVGDKVLWSGVGE